MGFGKLEMENDQHAIDWQTVKLKFESADSFRDDPFFKHLFHQKNFDKIEPLGVSPTVIFTCKEVLRNNSDFQCAMESWIEKKIVWFYSNECTIKIL